MSLAEELLNSLTDDEIAEYAADRNAEPHIVVNPDKTVAVPAELKNIAVQFDHNVKTVTFDCPRFWDGRDLMDMAICINYKTPNNALGQASVKNVIVDSVDSTLIHFDWVITKNVTLNNGTLSFLICGVKTDDSGIEVEHWNSELNREMSISEGLECTPSILEGYPDVIADILIRLRWIEEGNVAAKQRQLIVTLDENGEYASHSASEILAHISGGGSAVLEIGRPVSIYAYPHCMHNSAIMFALLEVTDGVTQTLYVINDDKSCNISKMTPDYGESGTGNTGGEVSQIDFSNFENGIFTETVDGEVIPHTVTFDDQGRPSAIDGATIVWGSST